MFKAKPIVPDDCLKYDRTKHELEEFFLFTTVSPVAVADIQAAKLNQFLEPAKRFGISPFAFIKLLDYLGMLYKRLYHVKMGRYNAVVRCWREFFASGLNLKTCTPQDLEKIYGIGRKTSRFFVCYSRPDARHAILDTHTLKFLRERGYDAPRQTPGSDKKYRELEAAFIAEANKENKSPVQLDQEVWKFYQVKVNGLAIR